MIIIMKPNASQEAVAKVKNLIEARGLTAHLSQGAQVTIVGVVGDKTKLAGSNIEMSEGVDKVMAVTESYKLVNKKFHPEDSVIPVGNTHIGPGHLTVMAGPCAVESREQLMETAFAVKKAGASFLRGGAYKPRTSPYSFQGLEEEGLRYMKEAREATGLNVICEVTSEHAIETAVKYVDMLQIGARNMQNFELLKEAGKSGLPVLLKRGLCATIDEWLNAAEYIPISSSVSGASAPTRPPPGTPWISVRFRLSVRKAICPSSWTPATPPACGPMWSPWPRRLWLLEQTA